MNQIPKRFDLPKSQQAQGLMRSAVNSVTDSISAHPSPAVFTAFAVGLGLGIGLALVFGGSSSPAPGMREQFTQFLSDHIPGWAKVS